MSLPSSQTSHNILLSHHRTCSHLLIKILNLVAQPRVLTVQRDGYHFTSATKYRLQNGLIGKRSTDLSLECLDTLLAEFQAGYDQLAQSMQEAERCNKVLFTKEHVPWLVEPYFESAFIHGTDYSIEAALTITPLATPIVPKSPQAVSSRTIGNETCLPDSILKKFHPTFLIRHPALAFPSMLRTSLSTEGETLAGKQRVTNEAILQITPWEMTYHWSRCLFDWYASNLSLAERRTAVDGVTWPVVLDADDISDKMLIEKYCRIAGLEYGKVRWEWDVVEGLEREKLSGIAKKMNSTLLGSKKIIPGKTADGLDVEVEKMRWKDEFGAELAGVLAEHVDNAMGDYCHLKQRKLRSAL